MMRVIIYNFESTDSQPGRYSRRLSNGETLLERQFRLLLSVGITKIEIAGDQRLYECVEQCIKSHRGLKRMSVVDYQEKLSFGVEDEVLLISCSLAFTQNVLEDIYGTNEKCQVLAAFRQPLGYEGLSVRLDMDYITEISGNMHGIDCAPVYPMLYIKLKDFEELPSEELEQALCYDGNQAFMISFLEKAAEKIKGILLFEDFGDMEMIEPDGDYQISGAMLQKDEDQRVVFRESGASVKIKALLDQSGAEHILLIHDEAFAKMPLEELFRIQGMSYQKLCVKDTADAPKQKEAIKQKLLADNIEYLVVVGDDRLICLADQARKELLPEQINQPEIKLMAVPDVMVWDHTAGPDTCIIDSNLVYARQGELRITHLGTALYHCFSILQNQQNSDRTLRFVTESLQLVSEANKSFFTDRSKAYQALVEACYLLGAAGCAPDQVFKEWTVRIADASGCERADLECLLIPELTVCLMEKFCNPAEECSENSLSRLIGNAGGMTSNPDKLKGKIKRYYFNLLEQGFHPEISKEAALKCSSEFWAANGQKENPGQLNGPELEGVLSRSIEHYAAACKEYGNTEAEEPAGSGGKPKQPLKKRVIKRLKKIKFLRSLNVLIRKKWRFKLYQLIYPVNTKWIVFEAYGGTDHGFSCNTRAIYEAMLKDPDYFDFKFIWAFKQPGKFSYLKQNGNTVVVKRDSKRYIKFCARSKYIFTNTGMPKYIKPGKNQNMVYTWHGKPLKRIGCSFQGESEGKRNKKQLVHDYTASGRRLTTLLSPSPIFSSIMADAYNLTPDKRKTAILETGYPRNDYLFKYTQEDVLRNKISLRIPLDKKVILYAPTWRPFKWVGGKKFEHTPVLDLEKLRVELGDDYVFLCRLHHLERDSMHFDQFPGFLYDVSMVEDVNELYIISDLLISDYSGTVVDFANLKRPIVLFMYDKEEYADGANGLNFDLDFLPGPIAETQDELIEAVKSELKHFKYEGKYKTFNETCNCLDGPDCAIRTAKQIVDINPEASAKQQLVTKVKIFGRNTKLTLAGWLHKIPLFRDENTRKIASYRNKYKGERCFLIGNGPSLRLADLNRLTDEYCFGCNMIYKVFERSPWRPDFLCASDRVVARSVSKELQDNKDIMLWVSRTAYDLMEYKGENLIYVNNLRKEKYYVHGNMIEYYVPSIATVMTYMIELAMYMGFSEIYLLGVDFTIGRNQNDHFMNSYRDKDMTKLEHKKMRNMFRGENIGVHEAQIRFEGRALYAYEKLAEFAKKKGYRVYNATRGGMLEVFERADLDEVLKGK